MGKRAVFLDRDGVINLDYAYVHTQEEFHWVSGVLEAARQLVEDGWTLVVVTNQSGIARGYYSVADFQTLTDWMKAEFTKAGAPLAAVYFCPHHPEKAISPEFQLDCNCRKPRPGMLLQAAADLDLDLARSVMFGDKPGDMTAGVGAGCPERVLLGTDGKAVPERSEDATQTFRSLAEAVASPWYQDFLARMRALD